MNKQKNDNERKIEDEISNILMNLKKPSSGLSIDPNLKVESPFDPYAVKPNLNIKNRK